MIAVQDDFDGCIEIDVPAALYHQRNGHVASKTALEHFRKSPAHYLAWHQGQRDIDTPAMAFGRAMDCALFEPEVFAASYAVMPEFGDCRRKEPKEARDAWRLENRDKTWLTAEDAKLIGAMAESIRRHSLHRALEGGAAQVTLQWTDPATGVKCKGRADYHLPSLGIAVDLKTTEDASPRGFARSVAKYGYHRQDAFYRRGFAAAGQEIDQFLFVAVEKVPPFAVGIYTIDADALWRADDSISKDLAQFAECVRLDEWPGYSDDIGVISLPEYAF